MIRRRRFKNVLPANTNGFGDKIAGIKRSIKARFGFSNPELDYHIYETKETFTKSKKYLPGLIAIAIAVFGLIIIDLQFAPIQTPSEILGKQANLLNMCALLFIVIIWTVHLKQNKTAIYR